MKAVPQLTPAHEEILEQILAKAREDSSAVWDQLAARVEEHFEKALEERARAAREQGAGRVRRQFSSQLTQALRRLRQFEDEARWSSALLDATTDFCDRAALFTRNGGMLQLRAVRGMIMPQDFPDLAVNEAPAFANVEHSGDTVVALRTRGELSTAFADASGEAPDRRCWLFPVKTRERLAAILYADVEEHIEIEALELVTAMAGLALDTVQARTPLVSIATAPKPAANGSPNQLRAQRFARVRMSRLLLEQPEAVQAGRSEHDLYSHLRADIDSVRDSFRREFVSASPGMADYLHLEFLRILASDDATLLGPDYPGPMA